MNSKCRNETCKWKRHSKEIKKLYKRDKRLLVIQVDIGGHLPSPLGPPPYWWPPTKSTWTPTIVSFSFSVRLILAQFTIFSSFSSLELPELFWGRKWQFFGKNGSKMDPRTNYALRKVVFLGYIFLTRYSAHQTEIVCQSYDPGKLMYQFTQTGPTVWRQGNF